MTPYLLTYLFASIFSFCYSKSKDKSATVVFASLTFITLFLPLALRYGIGTDYNNYVRIVQDVVESGVNEEVEFGWTPLFLLIRTFHLDIHWFFVIPAFFATIIILKVVPKEYLWFCIPPYIAIYWLESFSLVRQAFAASIFFLALQYFFKRKYFAFCFWAALSFLFHKSMIILLVLTPLSLFRWRILTPWINCAFLFVFYIITRFVNIPEILMDVVVGNTMYARYVSSQFNMASEGGSGMGLYIRLVIFLLLLTLPFVPYNKVTGKKMDASSQIHITRRREYNLLCLCVFALMAGHVFAYQIHIFNRIPNIFSILYVFFAYKLMNARSKYRKIGMFLFQLFLFILFLATLRGAKNASGGGLGIIPYQSIFQR